MKFGYASPRRMLDEMPSRDLGMWLAFLRLGTPEDDTMDERFAVLTAASLNGPHFTRADKKPYTPLDFLPKRQEAERILEASVSRDIRAFFMNRGK